MSKNLKIILSVGVFFILGGLGFLLLQESALGQKTSSASQAPDGLPAEVTLLAHSAPGFLPSEHEFHEIDRIIHEKGFASAKQHIKANYQDAGGILSFPHALFHFFGKRLAAKFGVEGALLCDATFTSGCYHGAFSRAIQESGIKGAIRSRDICYRLNSRYMVSTCIHGLGHGLLKNNSLNLEEALPGCEIAPNDTNDTRDSLRSFCEDGVFMEYFYSVEKSALPANDLWYPCSAIPEKYKVACSKTQPRILRVHHNLPFSVVAEVCLFAISPAVVSSCFRGLGDFIGVISKGEVADIKRDCGMILDLPGRDRCFTFAAIELPFHNFQGAKHRAPKLCDEVSENARANCLSRLKAVEEFVTSSGK